MEKAYTLNVPTSGWSGVDIPLSSFDPVNLADIIQLKFEGNGDVFLDNIYFYTTGGGGNPTEPTQPAPTPTQDAANVVSIFSDLYTDINGTDFFPNWGQSTVVTVEDIQGDAALKYTGFNYQGIQLAGSQDLSDMEYLHVDMWTVDATVVKVSPINNSGSPMEFLVSMFPISAGMWNSYDIPVTEFTDAGMSLNEIIQIKFDGQEGVSPSNIYLDNIYFYKTGGGGGTPTEPATAAPAPGFDAASVISLFSNEYTNVGVDTWSAEWDAADLADVQISGDDVKLYINLVFAGIETTSQTIDASEMTHFFMSFWTPDDVDTPSAFKIKLVDFGEDGAYQGGDDVEHEITFNASSSPSLASGSWVNLNIPLSDFVNLTKKAHIAQIIISGDVNTVYADNMLFHK
ncbi:MAG: hypothetical protein JW995_04495 [Melioribacteraceae bacterium]|nr:hypothetical protein [Melioribacteraceae bacterium]